MEKHIKFLNKLADLCDEYNATFAYTTDDDGIHVQIKDIEGEIEKDILIGYMFDAPFEFRLAASLLDPLGRFK